jgi:hypothetical protein
MVAGAPSFDVDCGFCCLLSLRSGAGALPRAFETAPTGTSLALAWLAEFASAARNEIPVGFAEAGAGVGDAGAAVDVGAIRTPLLLHAGCQHLGFAWTYAVQVSN